jgi:hypothetical protein
LRYGLWPYCPNMALWPCVPYCNMAMNLTNMGVYGTSNRNVVNLGGKETDSSKVIAESVLFPQILCIFSRIPFVFYDSILNLIRTTYQKALQSKCLFILKTFFWVWKQNFYVLSSEWISLVIIILKKVVSDQKFEYKLYLNTFVENHHFSAKVFFNELSMMCRKIKIATKVQYCPGKGNQLSPVIPSKEIIK